MSSMVLDSSSTNFCFISSSRSAGFASATCFATAFAKFLKLSVLATKSVSQLTSTSAPVQPQGVMYATTAPSAAIRPAFLAACASPFSRSQSMALSMSPSDSTSAFLQSIMPALVRSRSSLTRAAVIFAIRFILQIFFDVETGLRGITPRSFPQALLQRTARPACLPAQRQPSCRRSA